jgi:hypothetical protein
MSWAEPVTTFPVQVDGHTLPVAAHPGTPSERQHYRHSETPYFVLRRLAGAVGMTP